MTGFLLEFIGNIENAVVTRVGWPLWALRTVEVLVSLILLVGSADLFSYRSSEKKSNDKIDSTSSAEQPLHASVTLGFRAFQVQYLSVFFIIMLADWLQGTNMYTLYLSYGVNVGNLFLTGFLSSAIFGTFLGIFVDSWGRKLGCIVFCLLEVIMLQLLFKKSSLFCLFFCMSCHVMYSILDCYQHHGTCSQYECTSHRSCSWRSFYFIIVFCI